MEYTIRKLAHDEGPTFLELVRLFGVVFEMKHFTPPPTDYLSAMLKNDGFIVFVAEDGRGVVVGGLTTYVLAQYYSTRPIGYVFDLAVREDVRRHGIARALLDACRHHCKTKGFEEIFVQADVEDTHAVSFYQSTGGIPEQVIHFTYPLT